MSEKSGGVFDVTDDGGAMLLTCPSLAELQKEAEQIASGMSDSDLSDSHDVRRCVWPHQSTDGRKRNEAFEGSDKVAQPFDGATDARAREADLIINEQVELCVLASVLSVLRILPVGVEDTDAAVNLQLMLDYYLEDQCALEFFTETMRLANFVFGTSPGAGVMGIEWRQEKAVELKEVSLAELQQMWVVSSLRDAGLEPGTEYMAGTDPAVLLETIMEDAAAFVDALINPDKDSAELEMMVQEFFPSLNEARVQQVVKQAREQYARGGDDLNEMVVEFPHEYERVNRPAFSALEIGSDIFMPRDVESWDDGAVYFISELLAEHEVKTRAEAEDWDEDAVDRILSGVVPEDSEDGKKVSRAGMVTFKPHRRNSAGQLVAIEDDVYKNRFEVLTAVFKATNSDGVPGIYQVRFAMEVERALTKRELRRDKHGKYPGVFFAREYLDRNLLNSRGICDLEQAPQGLVKLFLDTAGDNAQFTGVPPIVTRRRQGAGGMYVEPMEEIKLGVGGDAKWMNPPAFPSSALKMLDILERRRDDYWGRANGALPPVRNQMRNRFTAMTWLKHLREVYVMAAQLIMQYAPEETVERVLNGAGRSVKRGREEIQGLFDFRVQFDVDVLNPETLEKKLNVITKGVLSMDNEQTVDKSTIVSYFMHMLNPELARASVRPVEAAQKEEMEDEARQYEKIRAGVPTDMPTDGSINAPLRLQFYQGMASQNPIVFKDMGEDKQQMLEERVQYLQHQAQQFGENAQTGRTGVDAAVGGMMSGLAR